MKKITTKILFLIAAVAFVFTAKAQTIKERISNKDIPVYFYGIDFTKTVLIGDSKANAQDIVSRQFAGINDLLINESGKYDVAGAVRRSDLKTDLTFVNERNEKADPDKLLSSNPEDFNRLSESDITTLIKGFNAGNKEGIGLLFIVGGMSKPDKAIAVWVTWFDIRSKKVLLTDKITGKVGMGFSFRNYWATGIKNVIEQIRNKKYNSWKSE
ncbi:hypothetical protein A8C56_19660 [Niabella ginsenosidivorans]|uniref:DUF2380 domain-containing protein n=1 Tax=Niabella ginsenosidivorans TaxID=1176587 RepID=A0A1A9I5E7_9BACT|nr:hypothetical protein [Niabella ginsenosidivorans]ANH82907.1 hypothetical protein A8C56_19660 [Niabella ginsenosidivorans]